MKTNANPVYTTGTRNALCPFYENCLDHAVEHHWRFWTCRSCAHKNKKSTLLDAPMTRNTNPEYTVPPDLL